MKHCLKKCRNLCEKVQLQLYLVRDITQLEVVKRMNNHTQCVIQQYMVVLNCTPSEDSSKYSFSSYGNKTDTHLSDTKIK